MARSPWNNSIDGTIINLNILKIIADVPKFREWLKSYHHIKNDDELFKGYKFFISTVFKCLLGSIDLDSGIKIDGDFVYYRANFYGVPIEVLPNTCDKTILVKNIWRFNENIQSSSNWNDIEVPISKLKELFSILDKLSDCSGPSKKGLTRDYLLNIKIQDHLLISFNDTSRGWPKGSINSSVIIPSITEEEIKDAYRGYVYSLQYIWYNVLVGDNFKKSCINDLTEIDEKEIIDSQINDDIDSYASAEGLLDYKLWMVLDSYFGRINEEIISHIEGLTFDNNFILNLHTTKKDIKAIFKPLLDSRDIKQPSYLIDRDDASLEKLIDYYLLWYEFIVLNESNMSCGVPLFIELLLGAIQLKKDSKSKDKPLVRIFKHPTNNINEYNYSYAILIDQSSWIADSSRWIILYNYATNYSGTGRMSLNTINKYLETYKNEIEQKELIIGREFFINYAKSRMGLPKFADEYQIEKGLIELRPIRDGGPITKEIIDETNEVDYKKRLAEEWDKCLSENNKQSKGRLLEKFVSDMFSTVKEFKITTNKLTENEEIDLYIRNNVGKPYWLTFNSPHLFIECKNWSSKVSSHEIEAFETKLRHHSSYAKIGFFIATNGYESGCVTEQVRSNDGQIIVLVSGKDISDFLKSSQETIDWLEDLISDSIK